MDIANFEKEKWNDIAETLCYEGIRQKFIQNPTLMDYLLETGNKTIVEATYDNVWGHWKNHWVMRNVSILRNGDL